MNAWLTNVMIAVMMLITGYGSSGISMAMADNVSSTSGNHNQGSDVSSHLAQDLGRSLVRQHCTRCHVVADINPYGGIGSTPSFEAMKTLSDWRERFEIFYLLPPHPSVIRIDGISEDRPENLPAFSHEILLTIDEHEAILGYVDGLEKK